ncbi:MAG: class II aldolase/adducin family protein [Breznakiellaceae bacterium]
MRFDMLHPADQIVMIMERVYQYGMTTTSGGNLSIKDENGDIWISPAGVDKGSLRRDDVVCVKKDGSVVGHHRPSSEFPFHKTIYERRPDLGAILHAHPPALVAFSIVRKIPLTTLIPNVQLVCGPVAMAPYAVPGSQELGENIAAVFEKGINTVLLENHGIVVGAADLFRAFMAFETLDFCARLEISARRIGIPRALTQQQIDVSYRKQAVSMEEFDPLGITSEERAARRDMCTLIHRSYDQGLFSSTQGTFSQRLEKNDFIITPYGKDRKYLEPEDLVRIQNGKKEKGKTPSRSVLLHQRIYELHPHINSIIIAHPPSVMVFAITEARFNSRTIPESYILLRTIPTVPFGSTFMDQEKVARSFSKKTPIVMVENDCIIVTGSTLLNAFDRLEVAEYSAKALIAASELGEVVAINDAQVAELEAAFHLD